MDRTKSAVLCSALLLTPAGTPRPPTNRRPTQPGQPVGNRRASSHGVVGKVSEPYRPKSVPPPSVGNSGRLDSLLRAGNLDPSVQDAIALALEIISISPFNATAGTGRRRCDAGGGRRVRAGRFHQCYGRPRTVPPSAALVIIRGPT